MKASLTNVTILQPLAELVAEMNKTNSKNDKVEILKRYPQCQRILRYVYDPLMKFNVTSANVRAKGRGTHIPETVSIFKLLDCLMDRILTGQEALDFVADFILHNSEYEQLVYMIIDKNLEVRVDESSINKAFPGLIPTFDVALAHPYEKHKHKVDLTSGQWYASRKLDGCRAICVVRNGAATFWSRTGHQFETLDVVAREVEDIAKKLQMKNFVLDGEMCVINEQGVDNFKSIVSQIKRKNFTIQNARYMVFDIVGLEAFENKQSKATLTQRQKVLQKFNGISSAVSVLPQTQITSEAQLTALFGNALKLVWEGLILRKDVPYEGKRTSSMLKMKDFKDAEYKVLRVEHGPFRTINAETGLEETIETVTNVIINHKGSEVSVGSGFSQAERNYFHRHSDKLVGATITVSYFEETTDKSGAVRLRFPTLKHIYVGGRSV